MDNVFDVAVIGGGAAGLMAASVAAQAGAKVVLIEKNPTLGNKLLLTGGKRCNLTNLEMTKEQLVDLFGNNGKFLYSGLSTFGVAETVEYFESQGLAIKTEANGCLFTQSDNSSDVVSLFQNILEQQQVLVKTNLPVLEIVKADTRITKIVLSDSEINAKQVIICTGGLSFPTTGSTGDGFNWAAKLGHTIVPLRPALTPIYIAEPWIKQLQGLSFTQALLTIYSINKKIKTYQGDLLFTDCGLSGPLIHSISRSLGELQNLGSVILSLDLFPELTLEALDKKLQTELHNNRILGNYLETLISLRLAEVIMQRADINPNLICNTITKEERKNIVALLKGFTCTFDGLAGYEKAMITTGGVALKEIDAKTMKSKLMDNLYFAGEVLDLDGPSGGYNLQVCWTTGYLAGQSAAQNVTQS